MYWKDHDGSSYLVTAQNVGAYSSQALDDGNIAFVYAVHLGTEWHLNYRVFDPSSKSFLTEETTIASNVYAEAIGGQYISVNITALGSGGLVPSWKQERLTTPSLNTKKVNMKLFLI